MSEKYLLISDDGPGFATIEGEGRLIGRPSIFLRLFGCNLTCRAWVSPDSPWGCDSYISWSKKNKYTFEEIFDFYEKHDFIKNLQRGDILKITGGEPFLRQKPLLNFIEAFIQRYDFYPHIDFETNATIMPYEEWDKYNPSYTSSPKLSSNGDDEKKTYKPDVLRFLISRNACFKFVINTENDLEEIYRKYINSPNVNMPKQLIWLMVCCGSRKEHIERAERVATLAIQEGFNFSPRLQLIIWDQALKR